MADPADGVDVAILTAIAVERRAVCAAFGLTKEHRVKKRGRWYWCGQFALANGSAYDIVVAQPADMGQIEAAALTKDVLRDWKPNAAILVGIAGSSDPEKVKLGDVVVGKSVWYYEHGKITPQGARSQPEMIPADALLLQHLTGVDDWDGKVAVLRPDSSEITAKVHYGVIASGEKVIASEVVREEIASGHRKIIAIAMEDYGFSRAIWQSTERVQHLVFRGNCDYGNEAKDDRWHEYAAATAAGFARHFLVDRPLEPRHSHNVASKGVISSVAESVIAGLSADTCTIFRILYQLKPEVRYIETGPVRIDPVCALWSLQVEEAAAAAGLSINTKVHMDVLEGRNLIRVVQRPFNPRNVVPYELTDLGRATASELLAHGEP